MNGAENQRDADHTALWPELEAALRDLEHSVAADAVVGDPTAPWEGLEDEAVVQLSGAVLKALCDITATAEGALEWRSDGLILHSGTRAPVPLRFQICASRS